MTFAGEGEEEGEEEMIGASSVICIVVVDIGGTGIAGTAGIVVGFETVVCFVVVAAIVCFVVSVAASLVVLLVVVGDEAARIFLLVVAGIRVVPCWTIAVGALQLGEKR